MKSHWAGKFKRAPVEDRTSPDGITHHSAKEMQRWCRLLVMQREGYISELQRQIPFPLILPNGVEIKTPAKISRKTGKPTGDNTIVYRLDFQYKNAVGQTIYEEYKGFMTPEAALKIAVVEAIYGIKITVVKKP